MEREADWNKSLYSMEREGVMEREGAMESEGVMEREVGYGKRSGQWKEKRGIRNEMQEQKAFNILQVKHSALSTIHHIF